MRNIKINNVITGIIVLAIAGLYYIAFHKNDGGSIPDLSAYTNIANNANAETNATPYDTVRYESIRVYDGVNAAKLAGDVVQLNGASGSYTTLLYNNALYPEFFNTKDGLMLPTSNTGEYAINWKAPVNGYIPSSFTLYNGNISSYAKIKAGGFEVGGDAGVATNLLTANGGTIPISSISSGSVSVKAITNTYTPDANGVITLQKKWTGSDVISGYATNVTSAVFGNCRVIRTLDQVTISGYITFTTAKALSAASGYQIATLGTSISCDGNQGSTCGISNTSYAAPSLNSRIYASAGSLYVYFPYTVPSGTSINIILNFTYSTIAAMPA